eukprot:COSAG02_NODE_40301_length_407_cov_0.675325_1_plen_49_part_10
MGFDGRPLLNVSAALASAGQAVNGSASTYIRRLVGSGLSCCGIDMGLPA